MNLSDEDKTLVNRAKRIQKFLTQPLHVAEGFSSIKGEYVPLEKTVEDVASIIAGNYDHLPEDAFYMVGTLEQAQEKTERLKRDVREK